MNALRRGLKDVVRMVVGGAIMVGIARLLAPIGSLACREILMAPHAESCTVDGGHVLWAESMMGVGVVLVVFGLGVVASLIGRAVIDWIAEAWKE